MNETVAARAVRRDERLQEWEPMLVSELQRRDPEAAVGTVGVICQNESILCGRIACEGLEGRLNERSIMLEAHSLSNAKVRLNISDCRQVAAFPGQIVGVVGRSGMTGNTFHVSDFLPGSASETDWISQLCGVPWLMRTRSVLRWAAVWTALLFSFEMLFNGNKSESEEIRLDEDTDLPEPARNVAQGRDALPKTSSGILTKFNLRFLFQWSGPGGQAAQYSVGELESKIYDNVHHNGKGELLLPLSILSRDESSQVTTSRKILHFTDWKAKLASQVCLVVVLISCIISPITFIWGGSWADPRWVPGGRTTMVLDMICDLCYLAYLILELKMSFMHPSRRVEVVDPSKILEFRLRSTTYVLRAFSATSYFWIATFNASLLLNLTKLVRIYHFVRLPDPLWLIWDNGILRELRPLLLLTWLAHWVGCLLAWGGGYREALWSSGDGSPFETTFNGAVVPGWFSLYFMAFVEALYMLTGALDNPLGDGGIRDKNFGALVMVAVFGPVGCIIVAHFIAAVVREQERKFALDIRHEENQAFVKRALENLNVPKELQRRVFSLHHFQKMSHDYEAFEQLFKNHTLSSPLEDAIRVYLYQSVLRSSFFNNKEHSYILAVVRVLEDKAFLPGDYVVRVGEVADEMYFISKGIVSVLVANGKSKEVEDAIKLPMRKKEGDHFGEVALIKGSLRTAWIKAETYVVASCLRRSSIEQIWKYFPHERESLQRQVLQTVMRDAARQATSIRQSVGGRSLAC
ncbi:HCN2 [Symbiodinium pilosum]|uniref:HCN2 protein n=1 Tax=Symbiodinium pilosum TaxID=2952 RepID=A0A812UY47_SYMPI|nr:HCN2 [Symbiodinium pilosum]